MLIRKRPDVAASEITDEQHYVRRREFMRLLGGAAVAAGAMPLIQACSGDAVSADFAAGGGPAVAAGQTPLPNVKPRVVTTDEALNSFEHITSYNNFYEFGTGKDDPQRYAGRLTTSPWKVKIDGHCAKPADYHLEDLIRPHQLEERIYRLRCVEAWSMVIPWVGIPLAEIIKRAEPTSKATFVAFTTLERPNEMFGQNAARARLALRRRAADGRSDAPAHDPVGRALRQDAHEPERRADPSRRAVEVRVQEHQVDRPHPVRGPHAADRVEQVQSG